MIVVPYKYNHMMELATAGIMECGNVDVDMSVEELAIKREKDIGASTALHNGKVVACAGVQEVWPGIGELWSLFSLLSDEHYIEVSRISRDIVGQVRQSGKLRRIQCHVRIDFYRGLRLAQFVGFEEEGITKRFCPDGSDCYLFSITG